MEPEKFNIIWTELCTYPCETGIARHKHGFFHFLYVDEGMGDIKIEEKDYKMQSGNIFLVPPDTAHEFSNSSENPLKTLEIKFSTEDGGVAEKISSLPFCMNVKNYHIKSSLLSVYRESLFKKTYHEDNVKCIFQMMLTYLFRCFENMQSQRSQKENSYEIEKVIEYINENLEKDITLEMLADIAGFEKNYFLRKFKKITNYTPMQFLQDARIEKAKDLLSYSDMNVSQIADATGFKTIHYFSNVFMKSTGVRPIEYRKDNGII